MHAVARIPGINLRFSLKGMFLLMAALAVGAAAFRDGSQAWMIVFTSLAFAVIFFAILAALYGHCDRQAFWTGFAICAAPYFIIAARFNKSAIVASLATTKAIDFITDKSHPCLSPENSKASATKVLPYSNLHLPAERRSEAGQSHLNCRKIR